MSFQDFFLKNKDLEEETLSLAWTLEPEVLLDIQQKDLLGTIEKRVQGLTEGSRLKNFKIRPQKIRPQEPRYASNCHYNGLPWIFT